MIQTVPEQKTGKSLSPERRFKKITTLTALTDYIRRQLGEPVIQVEVTDEQIEDLVYQTIEQYGEYAYQGREDIILLLKIDTDQKSFILDDRVKAVTNLRQTNNLSSFLAVIAGYTIAQSNLTLSLLSVLDYSDVTNMTTALSRLSNLESIFDLAVNYTWNENTKELRILEALHKSNYMLLELSLQYEPKEIDNIYNHPWIKKMATAKVKRLWGNITSKYDGTLINGTRINGDQIRDIAQQEIDTLTEELMNTYEEPLGIYVR